MRTPVPPHYVAFRVALLIVLAALATGAGMWFAEVLPGLLRSFGAIL
jgi:hypothetical protein